MPITKESRLLTAATKRQRSVRELKEVERALEAGLSIEDAAWDNGMSIVAHERRAYRYGFAELAAKAAYARWKTRPTYEQIHGRPYERKRDSQGRWAS